LGKSVYCVEAGDASVITRGNMETLWIHVDAMRMLKMMYDPEELAYVLMDLKNSDGWLIIPFNKHPVLTPTDKYIVRAYNYRLN
jgi:hypothetical protein